MKKHIYKKIGIFALAIITIVGCTEFIDKIDNFKIGITSEIFEQNAVIQLKDYHGNQEDISNTDFNIVFSGADADKLVNEAGEFVITATQGFIQLNVNPNKSQGVKELNFNLTVSGGTYRETTFLITLKDTTSFMQLQMVNEARILGIDNTNASASLINNTNPTEIKVSTTKAKSINTSSISIDAGTQFKDATGSIISGGEVEVQLVNVDPEGENTNPAFIDAKVFKDDNGDVITGKEQVLLGRTIINMKVNGKEVKEFDKPIAVSVTISKNIKNPVTGNKVQVGDTFPVYTNEDGSKEWIYHGLGTVAESTISGFFNVNFNTTHLSNFTVSYKEDEIQSFCIGDFEPPSYEFNAINAPENFVGEFDFVFTKKVTYTSETIDPLSGISTYNEEVTSKTVNLYHISIANKKVIATPPASIGTYTFPNGWTVPLYPEKLSQRRFVDVLNSGIGKISFGYGSIVSPKTEISLALQRNGITIKTDLSDIVNLLDLDEKGYCKEVIMDLSTLTVDDEKYKTIKLDVAANCGGNTIIPDGFPLYVESGTGNYSYVGTIKKGKLTLKGFELNKEYNFKSFYKGKAYTHPWTFTSTEFIDKNFDIPNSVCNEIGF